MKMLLSDGGGGSGGGSTPKVTEAKKSETTGSTAKNDSPLSIFRKDSPASTASTSFSKKAPVQDNLSLKDAVKSNAAKSDAPKTDAPKTDSPKADAPKADAPKADAPKADAPKADSPKTDSPKADAPKGDTGKKTDGGGAPLAPGGAAGVEQASTARRGNATSNDGRVDGGVREGNHDGARDREIARLQAEQRRLQSEREGIEEKIEKTDEEIRNDENTSNTVGTVVDVATKLNPITLVAGLFGQPNPIADAARGATEDMLGLEADRERLETEERDLERAEREIARELEQLEDERVLNFLADVAHVTNMPDAVADVLEGTGGVAIEFVDKTNTAIAAQAAYMSDSRSIEAADEVSTSVQGDMAELIEARIIDENGNILDAERFDAHNASNSSVSSTALLGVHEPTHASQDRRGLIEAAAARGSAIVNQARQTSRNLPPEDQESVLASARREAELVRIDMLEYDAYTNQETIEMQAGKEKQGFITINSDGSLLPREQAVENIYNFQMGLPILYGESTGMAQESSIPGLPAGEGGTPGRGTPGRGTPGRGTPGRGTPGSEIMLDGVDTLKASSFLSLTGVDDGQPGRGTPGRGTPGRGTPGRGTPGSETW